MTSQVIYLASGNPHKVSEIQGLANAGGLPLAIRSARAVGGMPAVVEDTGTFEGNARQKAAALWSRTPPGAWVLADDSGICVDALQGDPGVESAYFAGPSGDDDANLQALVRVMQGLPPSQRKAHYVCVFVLLGNIAGERVFRGECHGALVDVPVGSGGFGYDPLFRPQGYEDTFGVLSAATKQAISHRAKAWEKLAAWHARGTIDWFPVDSRP